MSRMTSKSRVSSTSRSEGSAERGLPPLRVRYWRRMKCQRVYDVEVTWDDEFAYKGPEHQVKLRLLVPGAQVVPAETTISPNDAGAKSVFHVTPLAKGWLPDQRLEVLVGGRKVQEITMTSKVVRRRFPLFFMLMTFLGPWFVVNYIEQTPFTAPAQELESWIVDHVPELPDAIHKSVPSLQPMLYDFYHGIGQTYESLHRFANDQPLAFYVFAGFLLLSLLALWCRRDKRKTRMGKPIPLPRAREEEEE